jgi:hypothetical protein
MRRTLIFLTLIPLLALALAPASVVAQAADTVSRVNPETHSARVELEHLRQQTGLTVGIFNFEGIGVLNFKKRDFAFRRLRFKGNGLAGAVSRDGSAVAIFDMLSHPYSFFVVQPGTDLVREYPGVVGSPACWSYDNLNLVLMRGGSEIQILDLASKMVRTLSIPDVSKEDWINSQCWSPDGSHIVYRSTDGYIGVYDLENRSTTKVAIGSDPTWSPDGNWIAYRNGETYYKVRPSGQGQKKLFHKIRAISPLYWSPDSRFVLYIHEDFFALDVEFYHLMVRRLADGSEESVADAPNVASSNIQWIQNRELIRWLEAAGGRQ